MSSSFFKRILSKLNESTDPAGLGIARFFFGLLMIIDIFDERGLIHLPEKWGDPDSCYFPLFDSLPRLSIEYIHLVYIILLVSAILIMLGFLYRLSCLSFVIFYWYIFMMDKTVWNNHSYLYGLLSILLLLTDAHHYWSVDGLLWPSIRNKKIPLWNYGIFRFQIFILYFFAGLKKLDKDWVMGYSMNGLSRKWLFDPFRMFLSNEMIDFLVVHNGGLVFDLTQGFMLYFSKTRIIAFIFGYAFHGMNAVMFSIGMFSYMCMAMMPIFCRPDWPKKIIGAFPTVFQLFMPTSDKALDNTECTMVNKKTSNDNVHASKQSNDAMEKGASKVTPQNWFSSFKKGVTVFVVILYVSMQLILPFSHSFTKGYNAWTNGLYGYSWDMMIHSWDTQHVVVKVVDKLTNKKQYLRPGAFVPFASDHRNRIFGSPDMIKQYAMCLAERIKEMEELEMTHPQIYFDVWKSLNDRYQQRMVDPRLDIVTAPWNRFEDTPWLRPLLVELSPWRSTLTKIRSVNTRLNNATDIVFVADFPGLFLENYIAPEIIANVTVLSGDVIVNTDSKNVSVATNETLSLESDATHIIYTTSDKPSCYMYVYYNTTWVEHTQEELIQSDAVLQKKISSQKAWETKSIVEKLQTFISKKVAKYKQGLWQLYFAVSIIFDIGPSENEGIADEL